MHLCARDLGYKRQPTLIHELIVFAAELATNGRVSARMLAACRGGRHAGRINASLIAHDLVVLSQPSQDCFVDALPTPTCIHSWSRRQQVMPLPQPSSRGRYSHGIRVLSTIESRLGSRDH